MALEDATRAPALRDRERAAIRALIAKRGNRYALDDVVLPVAVELAGQVAADDDRLERIAVVLEVAVLDALVHVARGLEWRAAT